MSLYQETKIEKAPHVVGVVELEEIEVEVKATAIETGTAADDRGT